MCKRALGQAGRPVGQWHIAAGSRVARHGRRAMAGTIQQQVLGLLVAAWCVGTVRLWPVLSLADLWGTRGAQSLDLLSPGNSTEEGLFGDGRLLKALNFFPIPVSEECLSDDGRRTGVCLNTYECRIQNGASHGPCALGFGVCCVFTATCGKDIENNDTYFVNPEFPGLSRSAHVCSVRVKKMAPSISQLRLDFVHFNLGQPNRRTGVCEADTFVISGGTSRELRLCGQNSGHHVYYDVENVKEPITVTMNMTRENMNRMWEIKVTQIEFNQRAPAGCMQYYTESSGVVQTMNFAENGRHLADQDYNICLRQAPGMCSIVYEPCDENSFRIGPPRYQGLINTRPEPLSPVGTPLQPGGINGYVGTPGGSSGVGANGGGAFGDGINGGGVNGGGVNGGGANGGGVNGGGGGVNEGENGGGVDGGGAFGDGVNGGGVNGDGENGGGVDGGGENEGAVNEGGVNEGGENGGVVNEGGENGGATNEDSGGLDMMNVLNDMVESDGGSGDGRIVGSKPPLNRRPNRPLNTRPNRPSNTRPNRPRSSNKAVKTGSNQRINSLTNKAPKRPLPSKTNGVSFAGYNSGSGVGSKNGANGVTTRPIIHSYGDTRGCEDRIVMPCDSEEFIMADPGGPGVCDALHCGTSFCRDGETPCRVESSTTPFNIRVQFSPGTRDESPDDNLGMCLKYEQQPCGA